MVTTTALKDSRDFDHNDVGVIAEVLSPPPAGVGAALRLAAPLRYLHEATDAYQAEVALLSRAIVVEGAAADSEPTDTSPPIAGLCAITEYIGVSRRVALIVRSRLSHGLSSCRRCRALSRHCRALSVDSCRALSCTVALSRRLSLC